MVDLDVARVCGGSTFIDVGGGNFTSGRRLDGSSGPVGLIIAADAENSRTVSVQSDNVAGTGVAEGVVAGTAAPQFSATTTLPRAKRVPAKYGTFFIRQPCHPRVKNFWAA